MCLVCCLWFAVCVRVCVLLCVVCSLSHVVVVRCFVVLLSGVMLLVVLASFLLSFGAVFHNSDFRFSRSSKLSDHTTS